MNLNPPVWCTKCNLRIAPYDLRTVHHGRNYHQDCFLRLVREEADEKKQGQAFSRVPSSEPGKPTDRPGRIRHY